MKLESLDRELFNTSCAEPHVPERLASQMSNDCTIEEADTDIQPISREDIPEENEGKRRILFLNFSYKNNLSTSTVQC